MISLRMIGLGVLALVMPPLAVSVARGLGRDFWINLVMTACFFLPGVFHAIWTLSREEGKIAGSSCS